MKLNNKGFAISGVLYSLLILFVTLFIGILTILATTKFSLDKVKNDITNKLETLNYRDTILNGADPELKAGMIPVTIDADGTVKKADMKTAWYDYDTKLWANAVVLDDNYASLVGNGKVNGATKNNDGYVSFDGVDDYINLGLENYEFGDSITYAIRLRVNSVPATNSHAFINNFEDAGGGLEIAGNKFNFALWFEGTNAYKSNFANFDVELGRWYTLVGTYDGNTMQLYVDGTLNTQTNVSGNILASPIPFILAANYHQKNSYYRECAHIDVSNVDIYNRALTADEVKNGYSNEVKIQNNEGLLKHVDFSNKTYNDNEIIPEESISQYYTWIPRYRYRLWYTEAIDGGNGYVDESMVHSINIVFEGKKTSKSNGSRNGEYLTHPAFTFGDEELNGFWVGKFETGYNGATTTTEAQVSTADSNRVIIKPNVYSWRYMNVSNKFYTCLNINSNNNVYGLSSDSDTHMMKNTEWGAVTYLVYSKYGKDSEVYINNNSSFLTGCGGDYSDESADSQCKNAYGTKTNNLYNQSTTGNISGLFDMSGGSYELVMGYTTAATQKYGESGFTDETFPDDKYVDIYTSTSNTQYDNRILGDATGEMGPFSDLGSSWYSNISAFVSSDLPWFDRGGHRNDGPLAGVSHFFNNNKAGAATTNSSFRVVIS